MKKEITVYEGIVNIGGAFCGPDRLCIDTDYLDDIVFNMEHTCMNKKIRLTIEVLED
jgi:hypothetical protein